MAKRSVTKQAKVAKPTANKSRANKPRANKPAANKPRAKRAGSVAPPPVAIAISERIAAGAADKLVGAKWFAGYTSVVGVVEARTLAELDGEQRGDAHRGAEFVIFKNGLVVAGDVRVGNYHSVYVVLGDLQARSIVSGDAVFIVTGDVTVSDHVLHFRNEGLFLRGTEKLPAIRCPLIFWFDRNKRETVLKRDGSTIVGDVAIAALLASYYSELDMDEIQLKPRRITDALADGKLIFK
jgi:hypothetical protein